jgi:hypothetical protein
MARLTKDELLARSDIREEELELPSIGGSVLVRSLAAAYSNQAQSEAVETRNDHGEQVARVNSAKLEALQVLHGLVDPKLDSVKEAEAFAKQVGPAWHQIVAKIVELSGIDAEATKEADTRFRASEPKKERSSEIVGNGLGSDGSDLHVPAGVTAGDADR